MKKILVVMAVLLTGCSSTQWVHNWKNPEIVLFHADKVLIVGMTQDKEVREQFETRLQKEFSNRGVEAMRSIDLFDVQFTAAAQTDEEIERVEEQLLDKGFDAILFTKVVGAENHKAFLKQLADFDRNQGRFKEDYLQHQGIYYDTEYYEQYTVYTAETALYCICVDKEKELIWRGAIDVNDPVKIEKAIADYIKMVVIAMEEQDLIFTKGS
jgi:hypothetical protein